jgi:hypothetical protein
MKRHVALGVLIALGFAASVSSGALAKSGRCAVKNMDGKKITWSCKAGRKCCFDWLANKGACIPASDVCL